MRLLIDVDLVSDDGGQITGRLSDGTHEPRRFSGWMELVRLIEDGIRVAEGLAENPRSDR